MINPDATRPGPWDPLGTLASALWLCGGQWAGKTTVARTLADRYGLVAYHYDYHDARAHTDRLVAGHARDGRPIDEADMEWRWVTRTPEEMATEVLDGFPARFEFALDDLRALYAGSPVIADGWGLRPELVWPVLDSPRRMVVMLPTDEFRVRQASVLPRARTRKAVSDPERAQRNRLERDRLVAQAAVRAAERLGIRVLRIDGSLDADAVADLVAEHWAPYLPERNRS